MATIPFIKQSQVLAGETSNKSNAIKVEAAEAITKNDILVGSGMSSGIMKVSKADANDINKCRGPFYVAAYTCASGDRGPLALPWVLVTGVDTSTYAVGDPVYLDAATAGGVVLPVPAEVAKGAAFSAVVKVGRIVRSHASTGAYLLEPAAANSAPLVGRVTLGGTSTTVLLGGTAALKLIGCPIVATPAGAHGTFTTAITAVVESDGAAGARVALTHPTSTDICSFMIQC
tara:strand:- start:2722 stop:3414 length:693 start_codon:yes stop_codon:yes gene_type:complete